MHRRKFTASMAALGALSLPRVALCADPLFKQPIRLIVPASPGGFTDVAARLIGDRLSIRIGQPVVVDNRAGASGIIGAEAGARSAPDGATLVMGSIQSHATNVPLFKKLPYDVMKDFTPVSRVAMGYTVLVVPASSPFRSLPDLIEGARKQPGSLTYGSGGAGASSHLCAEMLKQAAGIDVLHIPFKGTAPAVQALIGAQLSMLFDTVPSSLPHVKAGTLRALAVTSTRRLDALPDVPPVAEVVPGFEMGVWTGIYAPAGTPAALVDALGQHIQAVLREPAVLQRFDQLGFQAAPQNSRDFGAFTLAEIAKWTQVVRTGNITAD